MALEQAIIIRAIPLSQRESHPFQGGHPMAAVRYAHTNIVARDWKALALFYIKAFGCKRKLPERNLRVL